MITSDSYIGYGVTIVVVLHLIWMAYYCLVSRNYLVLDADEKHAIIATLTVDRILHTEHGYNYLEEHCLEELNPESLYCITEASELIHMGDELSLEIFKSFCEKFVRYHLYQRISLISMF